MHKTARQLAVEILNRIDADAAFVEPLLDAMLSKGILERPEDRHLLTQIVYGTLRMRGSLDWVIHQFRKGGVDTLTPPVPNILRTALYQLLYLERLPDYAVVDEAVRIARNLVPAGSGLVNAILRETLRKGVVWPNPSAYPDPQAAVSITLSHPLWLVKRWWSTLGPEKTAALCRANNEIPPMTLRVNTLKTDRISVIAALEEENISARRTSCSPDGVIIAPADKLLRETRAYRKGYLDIQDEASQLIARLVDPKPRERVLDLCAGTGGKTGHLAALMNNEGSILAIDHNERKIQGLLGRTRRLGVAIIEGHAADALKEPEKNLLESFDRVLLDAPCSGLGTLRRNPEIKWRLRENDIAGIARLQRDLLRRAAAYVRRGGYLVYSVCSIMEEENEAVVTDFLSHQSEFSCIAPPDMIKGDFAYQGRFFKTYPYHHGMDGFFAAVMKKNYSEWSLPGK